jgi:SulP family sulfate permease
MPANRPPDPSCASTPTPVASSPRLGRFEAFRRELGFELAVPALAVGLTTGMLAVIRAVSVSALVFAGELEPFAALGTTLGLISAILFGFVLAVASGYPGTVALAQVEPAAILALIAAAVIAAAGADRSGEVALATMIVAIAFASLLFGGTLFLLGVFRLGNLVRFIPYPVVAGFLAGVGWLLVRGSFTTMTSRPLGLEHFAFLAEPESLWRWLPGVGFGLALWFLQRRIHHYLLMPLVMATGIGLFYIAAGIADATLDDLRARGFLFEPPSSDTPWQSPLSFLRDTDWTVLWNELPTIGTLIVISVLAFLLIVGSLEVAIRRDIDLNRELRVTGVANMIGTIAGAFPGFHSLSGTILAQRMGAPVRLTGLIGTLLCAAVLFLGADAVLWLPKPVIGGLLFYLGLDFLQEWAYETRFQLAGPDYALVLIVLAITGGIGMLEGLGSGILIGIVLFVINYSRTSVVRHTLSGADFHSNVDRPEPERTRLGAHGEAIHVLRLQGYIFFGTANRLLALVRARLDDPARPAVRFVILDLARVIGLDSSAVLGFARMGQYAQDRAFRLVLTGLSPAVAAQLRRDRIGGDSSANILFFPDLDHAMEWCEDRLLEEERLEGTELRDPLADQLRRITGGTAVDVGDFLAYAEPFDIKSGEHLIRQKEQSNDLYFIETGKVSVRMETGGGRIVRLRTMGPGTIVGEVAFYLDVPRSASVVADIPTAGYRLTRANLERLRTERPDLAAMFHAFIAHRLAERVAETGRLIDTLIG